MDVKKMNVYAACDRVIKAMDRENVEAFGRLKMAKWDEINVIRTVVSVYRTSAKKARKRYYEEAVEAYILGMLMCGYGNAEAHRMADKAITMEWVDERLEETNFVTLYRFNSEAERKAYRLAEQLEVAPDRNKLIDRALREWARQLGQYAIEYTDAGILQAFKDAGIERVIWMTEDDEKTCHDCIELHRKEFPIDEVPPKPHYGCRCRLIPVL